MAETVDVIQKLIQLALKNPSREEAASAALKAVSLIDQYQIPIGANISFTHAPAEWTPPSADFMQTVEDILRGKKGRSVGTEDIPRPQGAANTLSIQDTEFVTQQEAWRQRMVDAWRALREERQRLEGEVHRYETETHRKFWGDGIHTRGW